jgi:hypothetical protein
MIRVCTVAGALLMFFSGCSGPSYTTEEIANKEREYAAKAVEIEGNRDSIKENVDRFIEVFSRYKRNEIRLAVPKIYAADAFLNDRIHSVIGSDAIGAYFDPTFDKMHSCEFVIQDSFYSSHDVYLRWVMRIQLSEKRISWNLCEFHSSDLIAMKKLSTTSISGILANRCNTLEG